MNDVNERDSKLLERFFRRAILVPFLVPGVGAAVVIVLALLPRGIALEDWSSMSALVAGFGGVGAVAYLPVFLFLRTRRTAFDQRTFLMALLAAPVVASIVFGLALVGAQLFDRGTASISGPSIWLFIAMSLLIGFAYACVLGLAWLVYSRAASRRGQ